MSGTILMCPSCEAPVAPRIETNLSPVLERYTCPVCGRMTLREELIRRVDLRMVGGGAQAAAVTPPGPTFGLLETLRPAGDLGDQSDTTLVQRTADAYPSLSVPTLAIALGDLTVTPASLSYLKFYARVGAFFSGLGPLDPQVAIRWRLGAAGTIAVADYYVPPNGVGVYSQIGGEVLGDPEITTDPNGDPWTVANINNLRVGCTFILDDNGTGETTTAQVTELWCEVWGVHLSPEPKKTVSFDEARELISEIAREGEGPDKFRALKMLMGLEGSGVGLPVPLTDNDCIDRLSRMIRAVGPTGSQIAYRRAFPNTKRSIDKQAPKITEADAPPIDKTKLPKNLRELYRMFPEIKKPGIPVGFPIRSGLEAQKKWCNDAAIRMILDREQAAIDASDTSEGVPQEDPNVPA